MGSVRTVLLLGLVSSGGKTRIDHSGMRGIVVAAGEHFESVQTTIVPTDVRDYCCAKRSRYYNLKEI